LEASFIFGWENYTKVSLKLQRPGNRQGKQVVIALPFFVTKAAQNLPNDTKKPLKIHYIHL
jgi:hypothetical protein